MRKRGSRRLHLRRRHRHRRTPRHLGCPYRACRRRMSTPSVSNDAAVPHAQIRSKSMQTWEVANQKGGVGKTSTVVTIGATLALRGHRVLLVDLDPHGSLTSYLGMDSDLVACSAYRLFM